MARLAEYLHELAVILGEPRAVHFVRLDAGSTVIIHKVEQEAIPKVTDRVIAVARYKGARAMQMREILNDQPIAPRRQRCGGSSGADWC